MRVTFHGTATRLGLVAALAVLAAGCNGETKYPAVPVTGKLTFADGKPLPKGTKLLFNPSEGGMGTASAVTDADGSFTATHVNGTTGAEVGKYTVVLRAPDGEDARFYKLIPKDYYDAGAFAVEVAEGMPPLDLKVKKK
jgi:hypothetical protein